LYTIQGQRPTDVNEDVQSGIFTPKMKELELDNVFTKYLKHDIPPTHHTGSKPISAIYTNSSLLVQKGIGFQADHRNKGYPTSNENPPNERL